MAIKSTNKVTINDNDKKFFAYLHAVKIAKKAQISRDTYQGLAYWGLSKRLYRLEKAGFIRGFLSTETDNFKVYSLTKRSFMRFLSYGDEKRKELRSDAIKHDLALVDIRYTLLKSPYALLKSPLVTEYFTENTLQTWKTEVLGDDFKPFVELNSDAALKIVQDGMAFNCALEYESSGKSISRYSDILRKYYDAFDIHIVFYIFESEGALNRAKNEEKRLFKNKEPKFFYTTFDKLVHLRNLEFNNHRYQTIDLEVSTCSKRKCPTHVLQRT